MGDWLITMALSTISSPVMESTAPGVDSDPCGSIKCADWVIDLGPEGGELGGGVVATGTPDEVAREPGSYTGQHLIAML